mmetsp:Transcript_64495/g.120000  ORF Transcript_64495/g.120000 Transcript_64495/m.120000 type:complete len:299 (+) Transcript_64495:80-976(+)
MLAAELMSEEIAIALGWVALSGYADSKGLVRLVKRASGTLRKQLDNEAVWRQLFLQKFVDRQQVADPVTWFQRWRRRQALCGAVGKATEEHPQWESGVVFAGAPRSGKSWLANHLCNGSVPDRVDKATVLGTDLRVTNARLLGEETSIGRVRLWEPSGAARKESVLDNYFRKADAIIIFIDASEHEDPVNIIKPQLMRASVLLRASGVLTLCCSKADKLRKIHDRRVHELQLLASEVGAEFAQCSALTGLGVQALMCQILAACREAGGCIPRATPVLSTEAGTLSNSELLSALLLHRR